MSEISLTGGTLIPSTKNSNTSATTSNQTQTQQAASTAHSHSHGHGQQCKDQHHSHGHHGHSSGGIELVQTPSLSLDELVNASPEEITRALSTLLRFGRYEALQPVLEQLATQEQGENEKNLKDLLQKLDDGGHSLYHWAAKRIDDIRFLQTLVDYAIRYKLTPRILDVVSQDNVGMRPLHWACTEGSIPHTALLLNNGAELEAKDTSGCTPLLIAAQYGQVEVVAYLLQKGANLQAVDTSHDSALHWAAYKGSIQVCGLLTYYQQLSFSTQDAYGQTPLHLAALRGHTSVVRYILQQLKKHDVLFLKDKNERTPLDLAIHKNRPTVEVVLKEAMTKIEDPRGYFLRKTLWHNIQDIFSFRSWKLWMGFTMGMDEMDEPTKFPFYFVIANFVLHCYFLIGVFAPFFNAGSGLLWDKSGWLLMNFIWMFFGWYFFYKTWKTKPGYLDESLPDIGKWKRLYEETLESYATDDNNNNSDNKEKLPLCHTCHVARPLRSKHCRVHRKCVLLFDHFCPFVDNTIGLYNYKYFYLFLFFLALAVVSFAITLFMYVRRYHKEHGSISWILLGLGIELCFTIIPIGGLCIYHTQLSMVNLSTNEHINVHKYKYLYPMVNGRRKYRNPWFKGYFGNFMDRMNPSPACYEMLSDYESLLSSDDFGTSTSGNTNSNKPRIEAV